MMVMREYCCAGAKPARRSPLCLIIHPQYLPTSLFDPSDLRTLTTD